MSATRTDDVDPLPSLLPAEGIVLSRLDVAARRALAGPRLHVAGAHGLADVLFVRALVRAAGARAVLVVAPSSDDAARIAGDLRLVTGGRVALLLPPESSPYAEVNPDRRAAMSRMAALSALHRGDARVCVTSAQGLVRKVVPRSVVARHTRAVVAEEEIDRDGLARDLADAGYLRVPLVEDPGTFAVRGALVDVWPPGRASPVRIELYGDLVLSIKPFDPADQRTTTEAPCAQIVCPPAREAVLTRDEVASARARMTELCDAIDLPTLKARALIDDVTSGRAFFGADGFLPAFGALAPVWEYLGDDAIVVVDRPELAARAVRAELERADEELAARQGSATFARSLHYETEEAAAAALGARSVVALHAGVVLGGDAPQGLEVFAHVRDADVLHLGGLDHEDLARAVKRARASRGKTSALAPLARRITHFQAHGLRVVLAARALTQADRLAQLLSHLGVSAATSVDAPPESWLDEAPAPGAPARVVVAPLSRGGVLPAEGLAVITEEEVFGARAQRARTRRKEPSAAAFLEDLRALSAGDYVVHVDHGVGRYQGLVHRAVGTHTVDLLVVEYAGGDRLYLPVYRLNQIQKYAGSEHGTPKLDRLGGATFSKTKSRVKTAVRQMADELLRLYAEREARPGVTAPPIDDEYRAFEATFPFDETDDQARAIDDVNRDLDTGRAMDRLVCGDVGFGKTEVALRGAFRVAMSGKQVAVLCPTTVLAQQHFRTFEARLASYPIELRVLSRFQTKKEQEAVVAALKEGKVDVVIGTHRLLSKDVHFKDLGLLVVDEEQRFGVTHKERIKQLKAQVDVLTLSATPIPRTLQMAIGGLRDLSLITTAPVDRRAVRTLVTRYDEHVLREAIGRELSRGGQVFYVYNRVEGIYEKAQRVQALFPEARIAVAHGQMSKGKRGRDAEGETELERTMLDFVEGRYDVLVATAIVESGLDIPRANTIVIDRADLFGLAQLYQIRGRVGRSKERAYCYLIVPPADAMTDEARSRIEALERHTELGSGFKIASLDLEIRGAGDLLGAEQSGNVASVGLDMFCHMLEEAVHELRGEEVVHDVDTELSFDVTALLPEDYVADVGVRLSLYKRLASAADESQVSEIAEEMEDRFGRPPQEARMLVELMRLKTELRRLRALGCEAHARAVTLHLRDDTPLDPQKIMDRVRAPKSPYKLTPDMRLTRRFDGGDGLRNCETMLEELAACMRD
ncbi:MAG: transcription-repair coupling factor [Polyangiaceae bacterium]